MKWGILATGKITNKFAQTVIDMKGEEVLSAVGSRRPEAAAKFAAKYGIEHAYGSYEELCSSPYVDAVYIATPNSMHFENAKMCLEAGKHVLCEKPFTTNAAQAEELYRLAEEKGLFIMEAFWTRFLPLLLEMRRLIGEGVIGDVKHARCDYGFVTDDSRKGRKFDSGLGGGALLDIGIYNLGFIHMVMGEAPVHFSSEVNINEYGTDDFSSILLEYPGGRTACVTTAIGLNMPREAAVFGTKGSISIPDHQHAEVMVVRPDNGDAYEVKMPFDVNGFEYQIREVNRCVKVGMNTSDILGKDDSLTVLTLMDDIRKSWDMKFSYEENA